MNASEEEQHTSRETQSARSVVRTTPTRTSTITLLLVRVVVLGMLAGGLLWLGTDYVDKHGPEGAGWSLRGNGSLLVLVAGFLLLLLVGWAALAGWQHVKGSPATALIGAVLLPGCIIVGVVATGTAASSWFASQSMARAGHTATLLADGRVLVMGGNGVYDSLRTAVLYDPLAGTWSRTASMPGPSAGYSATLLPSHRVLVAGGGSPPEASAYLYDPRTDTWSSTGSMRVARYGQAAVLLPTGKVLVAGGAGLGPENLVTAAEVYDPKTGRWSLTGPMRQAGVSFRAASLGNGKVLAISTYVSRTTGRLLVGTQVYDPNTGTWSIAPDVPGMGESVETAALLSLPDGRALAAGPGTRGRARMILASTYDPATDTWSAPRSVSSGRYDFTVTVLRDGRVLVAGGTIVPAGAHRSEAVTTAQLFDPGTGRWSATGNMRETRSGHTLTLLPSGKVLAAGGNASGYLHPGSLTAEVYDPVTGSWHETAAMRNE